MAAWSNARCDPLPHKRPVGGPPAGVRRTGLTDSSGSGSAVRPRRPIVSRDAQETGLRVGPPRRFFLTLYAAGAVGAEAVPFHTRQKRRGRLNDSRNFSRRSQTDGEDCGTLY